MKPRSLVQLPRDRIAKLLGMLGSDHDGEVLNAARMADRLVREQGITWFDVLSVDPAQAPQPDASHAVLSDWPVRWRQAASICIAFGIGILRAKDIEFANKVSAYGHRPSDAQLRWLLDLTQRVLAGDAP
jgi:hypothetical protein